MSKVYTRKRHHKRPDYIPTAVEERLRQRPLPSELASSWDMQRLAHRGIDADFVDSLMFDVAPVRMELPEVPVRPVIFKIYRPERDE